MMKIMVITDECEQKLLSRDEYFAWLKTLPCGYCPFCDLTNNILIKDGSLWSLILNKSPYWRYHFLLVPKRHFREFSDATSKELSEFLEFLHSIKDTLADAKLKQINGDPINRYLFFWRFREESLDSIMGVSKPDHFHFHIVPEKEHLWDSVIDSSASCVDIDMVREMFNK